MYQKIVCLAGIIRDIFEPQSRKDTEPEKTEIDFYVIKPNAKRSEAWDNQCNR